MILVDTNVLLDVLKIDPVWANRSQQALDRAVATDDLAINDVVYAELSSRFSTIEDLDQTIAAMPVRHTALPRSALFLAGKAFLKYRQSGGTKTGVLPDFFIGAHAAVENAPLLTRDTARIRTYFPTVSLITP
jgi:predicted nucleic acid-binding protein